MARISRNSLAFVALILLGFVSDSKCQDEETTGKCEVYASKSQHIFHEGEVGGLNACGAVLTCHTNDMIISLPKSLLLGIDREDLRLLDSECKATENGTHFSLKTALIGCGTTSRHSDNYVIYTNVVKQLGPPPTAIITRTPEVEISFSCYYSKYGAVSTGGVNDDDNDEIVCRNNRFYWGVYNPSYPVTERENELTTRTNNNSKTERSSPATDKYFFREA